MTYEPAITVLVIVFGFITGGMIYDLVIKDYEFDVDRISFKPEYALILDERFDGMSWKSKDAYTDSLIQEWREEYNNSIKGTVEYSFKSCDDYIAWKIEMNKMFEPLCDECMRKEASICSYHTTLLHTGNHIC